MSVRDAVIVSTARTPIGRAYKGAFNATPGATLGALSLAPAIERAGIEAAAEATYVRARPLDNTDFVMNWRKQMTREYTLRALNQLADTQ